MFQGQIVGCLGKNPEKRQTSNTTITTFSIATDHGYGDRKTTTWTRVQIFGKSAENAAKLLEKGDKVAVWGGVYLSTWTDRQGVEQKTLTLDAQGWEKLSAPKPREDEGENGDYSHEHYSPPPRRSTSRQADPDEEIPF